MNDFQSPIFFTNPIKALHRLRDAGFTEQQAEAQIEVFTEYAQSNLATKQDILDLKKAMLDLKRELKQDVLDLKREMKEMEMKLTIRMGTITSAVVGFFYVLEKFF